MNSSLRKTCADMRTNIFGIQTWRPGQEKAVHALLSGRDTFCVMPTGAGKSLCYQLPAALHCGLTLVISPLISLMEDQTASLRSRGIKAASIHSGSAAENADAEAQIRNGSLKLLYVSPERLQQERFRAMLRNAEPWLIVVDEAHCVTRWGHEFRPDYIRIGEFIQSLPVRPVVCAMTATADRGIRRETEKRLLMHHAVRVCLPMNRTNLTYHVHATLHRDSCIVRFAAQHADGQGIVYCATRKRTEETAALLVRNGKEALPYHAGLDGDTRAAALSAFQQGACRIICATTAFGMGVDTPHVRWILHDALPQDLTDYAQQTGRAGRDRQPSECMLLLSPEDLDWRISRIQNTRHDRSLPLISRLRQSAAAEKELQCLLDVLLDRRCIAKALSRSFGQRIKPCGHCSACEARSMDEACWKTLRIRRCSAERFRLWWLKAALLQRRGHENVPEAVLREAAEKGRLPDIPMKPETANMLRNTLQYTMRLRTGR